MPPQAAASSAAIPLVLLREMPDEAAVGEEEGATSPRPSLSISQSIISLLMLLLPSPLLPIPATVVPSAEGA